MEIHLQTYMLLFFRFPSSIINESTALSWSQGRARVAYSSGTWIFERSSSSTRRCK
ncbi:hypothetical protein MKW92_008075 [Papaver armeniacum]|nr:hypothetical protein MKW92_008075 [Papaver armeniacum]